MTMRIQSSATGPGIRTKNARDDMLASRGFFVVSCVVAKKREQ